MSKNHINRTEDLIQLISNNPNGAIVGRLKDGTREEKYVRKKYNHFGSLFYWCILKHNKKEGKYPLMINFKRNKLMTIKNPTPEGPALEPLDGDTLPCLLRGQGLSSP